MSEHITPELRRSKYIVEFRRAKAELRAMRRNDRLTWFLGAVALLGVLFIFSGTLHTVWAHIPPKVMASLCVGYIVVLFTLALKD